MRFKVDENLPPELAPLLRSEGHDALDVWDQGLRGRSDADLAEVCRRERRALVTLDLGFADIRAYPPADFSGIVVMRLEKQSRDYVLAVCHRILALFSTEPLEGHLWVVDERSIRVRPGPESE